MQKWEGDEKNSPGKETAKKDINGGIAYKFTKRKVFSEI